MERLRELGSEAKGAAYPLKCRLSQPPSGRVDVGEEEASQVPHEQVCLDCTGIVGREVGTHCGLDQHGYFAGSTRTEERALANLCRTRLGRYNTL